MPRPTIHFDKPEAIFFPGDTVSGTVILENEKPLKARSVTISWSGYSETRVKGTFEKAVLLGSKLAWVSENGENMIPAGTHTYPFSFVVSKNCPPTLKYKTASNEYLIEVEIDRPWKLNIRVKKEFVVTKYLKPAFKDGYASYSKTFPSGLIFNEGPITLQVSTPKLIFLPGETVNLRYTVNNKSSTSINEISATLKQRIHYHSSIQHASCDSIYRNGSCPVPNDKHAYRDKKIGRTTRMSVLVEPYSQETFTMPFTIPDDVMYTPNFKNGLMTVGYFLQVEANVPTSIQLVNYIFTLYIGEEKKVEKTKKEEAEKGAPPAYTA